MSTRSSYFAVGPIHLYREITDDWIHVAVGNDSYPDFAPKIVPAWKWLDRSLYWVFTGVRWRLWGRRRFLARHRGEK